jgi:hypothetical protein
MWCEDGNGVRLIKLDESQLAGESVAAIFVTRRCDR